MISDHEERPRLAGTTPDRGSPRGTFSSCWPARPCRASAGRHSIKVSWSLPYHSPAPYETDSNVDHVIAMIGIVTSPFQGKFRRITHTIASPTEAQFAETQSAQLSAIYIYCRRFLRESLGIPSKLHAIHEFPAKFLNLERERVPGEQSDPLVMSEFNQLVVLFFYNDMIENDDRPVRCGAKRTFELQVDDLSTSNEFLELIFAQSGSTWRPYCSRKAD